MISQEYSIYKDRRCAFEVRVYSDLYTMRRGIHRLQTGLGRPPESHRNTMAANVPGLMTVPFGRRKERPACVLFFAREHLSVPFIAHEAFHASIDLMERLYPSFDVHHRRYNEMTAGLLEIITKTVHQMCSNHGLEVA